MSEQSSGTCAGLAWHCGSQGPHALTRKPQPTSSAEATLLMSFARTHLKELPLDAVRGRSRGVTGAAASSLELGGLRIGVVLNHDEPDPRNGLAPISRRTCTGRPMTGSSSVTGASALAYGTSVSA
jgi:hypothetical protein